MALLNFRRITSLSACFAMVWAVACSSDDPKASSSSGGSSSSSSSGGSSSSSGGSSGQVATKDIVDTAVAAGSFKTLAELLTAADLVSTLKGAGPFTVLAPTDAAFAKLPAEIVATLKKPESKALLQQILTYHVVSGSVLAADVVKLKSAAPIEGENLGITVAGADVTLNAGDNPAPFATFPANKAKVTQTDIKATNGVIHVIDTVLIPPVVFAKLDPQGKDIVGTAVAAGTFTSLAGALTKAELVATLQGPGPFTVFAPTDAAFAKLGDISGLTKEQLTPILTYHVVPGLKGSTAVVGLNGKDVVTVGTKTFKVKVVGADVFLTDGKGTDVKVSATDIATKNGLIHVIDTVLSPP
jgi:transforming growth factor-beta-induced protein